MMNFKIMKYFLLSLAIIPGGASSEPIEHFHGDRSHKHELPIDQGVSHKHGGSKFVGYINENTKVDDSSQSPDLALAYDILIKKKPEKEGRYYVVKKGDTIFSILKKTGARWKDIVLLNQLLPPDYKITIGQKLFLGDAESSTNSIDYGVHDSATEPRKSADKPMRQSSYARTNYACYTGPDNTCVIPTNNKFNSIDVYYGTDRGYGGAGDKIELYGAARGGVKYGKVVVSLPFNHKKGELESPKWWKLEFSRDPVKHVTVRKIYELNKGKYFSSIRAALSQSEEKSALVFFHGYNVTFNAAARRTGQIAYDLGFEGVPAFYSWPSHGRPTAYTKDEANIKWSEPHIKDFLIDFAERTTADNIYLIAHSMGNRGFTRAISNVLSQRPKLKNKFKEIILTAPDIDAEIFKRDILPRLTSQNIPITLYASSEDVALMASKQVHGYPRAGEAGDHLVIADGLETIDATGVDTSFLGHSYFSETNTILSDIFYMTSSGLRANKRFSLQKSKDKNYWEFKH